MKLKDALKLMPHYTIVEIVEGNPDDRPVIAKDYPDGEILKPHHERTICLIRSIEKNNIRIGVYDRHSPVRY